MLQENVMQMASFFAECTSAFPNAFSQAKLVLFPLAFLNYNCQLVLLTVLGDRLSCQWCLFTVKEYYKLDAHRCKMRLQSLTDSLALAYNVIRPSV